MCRWADDFGAFTVRFFFVDYVLFLGCFVDQVSMMLVTLPFYMPLVQHYGFDPLWFGVMFLICMQLGLLTPPFGMLLFTMRGVAPPSIAMGDIFRAVMPYVLMGLAMLGLVASVPPLATWLPALLTSKDAEHTTLPHIFHRLIIACILLVNIACQRFT